MVVTEPDAGSDAASLRTLARREGGCWVLDGRKIFITTCVLADLYIVAARKDTEAKPSRGITLFWVEKGRPGFEVVRKLAKMGRESSHTAELVFKGARLHPEQVLAEVDRGFYAIMQNFQNERLVLAAQAIGEATRALAITLDYLRTRKASCAHAQAFGSTLRDKSRGARVCLRDRFRLGKSC